MSAREKPVFAVVCDVGLATFGIGAIKLRPSHGFDVLALDFWGTEKSDKKRGVLAADDDLRRAEELCCKLAGFLKRWAPAVMLAERKSLPRNASAAGKISLAWGVVIAAKIEHSLPLVQASPQEVRRSLGIAKNASKAEVQAALEKHTGLLAPQLFAQGIPKGKHEHPVDAVAAGYACQNSEIVRAVRPR